MHRVLFGFHWRRHRLAAFLCAGAPVLIGIMVGVFFPLLTKHREILGPAAKLIQSLVPSQLVLADLFEAPGAFNFPFVHPLTLLAFAVATAGPTLGLPAGERGRGGLELLLATPLRRAQIVGTNAAVMLAVASVVAGGPFAGAAVGGLLSGTLASLPFATYAASSANAFALVVLLGALGTLVSVLAADRGRATAVYSVLVGFFFLVDFGARLHPGGSWLSWLSPLRFYNPNAILLGHSAWGQNIAILLGLAVALYAFAARRFEGRRAA